MVFVLLLPKVSFAEDSPVKDIPPGADEIFSVKKGDPSPITGQVFSPETALRWANWLRQYRIVLPGQLEYERGLRKIEQQACTEKQEVEKKYSADIEARATTQIAELTAKLNNKPWYDSVWFGFAAGAVVTTAAITVTAVSLKK